MTSPINSIDINSITLRFGIGCFETLKINRESEICFLAEHLERLKFGIKTCNLSCPADQEIYYQLNEFINKQNLEKQRTYILRLIFTPEYGLDFCIDEYIENKNPAKLMISKSWFINSKCSLNKFKSFNYLKNHLAYQEALKDGFDDAVLLNEKGEICETTKANLFFCDYAGIWFTPSLESGCLPGIIRKSLINSLKAQEITILPAELKNFKLALMTNSLIETKNIEYINEMKFEIGSEEFFAYKKNN